MRYRCTDRRTIEPVTAWLALQVAPFDSDDDLFYPGEVFQCQMDDSEHRFHAAFVRNIPGEDRDVFLCWESGKVDQAVIALGTCMKRKEGGSEPCVLFKGHWGDCDWGFIDPQYEAARAELDQMMAYYDRHGKLPL